MNTTDIGWTAIGLAENLITNVTACPALPAPPVPAFSKATVCFPFSVKRTTDDNTHDVQVHLDQLTQGQYVHYWTVSPTGQQHTTSDDQFVFQVENPGNYEITCTRAYPGRRDITSTFSFILKVVDCKGTAVDPETPSELNLPDADIDITDIWENDFLLTTAGDSLAVFAHFTPASKTLYASLEDGTFISPDTLIAAGMFEEYAALFAGADPRKPLPVKLISFSAKQDEGLTRLDWSTAEETNSYYFEIEHSEDAKTWQMIGSVAANNAGAQHSTYHFDDDHPRKQQAFYRLKMVDQDETFAYSRIEKVTGLGKEDVVLFPNPIDQDNSIQANIRKENVAGCSVYGANGSLRFDGDRMPDARFMDGLPSGQYIIKIRLKNGAQTSRTIWKK